MGFEVVTCSSSRSTRPTITMLMLPPIVPSLKRLETWRTHKQDWLNLLNTDQVWIRLHSMDSGSSCCWGKITFCKITALYQSNKESWQLAFSSLWNGSTQINPRQQLGEVSSISSKSAHMLIDFMIPVILTPSLFECEYETLYDQDRALSHQLEVFEWKVSVFVSRHKPLWALDHLNCVNVSSWIHQKNKGSWLHPSNLPGHRWFLPNALLYLRVFSHKWILRTCFYITVFFLITVNEKEIYYFHSWVKLKSTSWGFYGPVQIHWRSVLNEQDNTLRHPCREWHANLFWCYQWDIAAAPAVSNSVTWIFNHQSEQFGLWKWALLLLLTFPIFLFRAPRIPEVPLTERGPFPALQKHLYAFPMFPAFALPLPLINENTRGCGLLSIWVEIQGLRGNRNQPVRLRCPWTSKLDPQKSAGIRNYFVFMPLKGND